MTLLQCQTTMCKIGPRAQHQEGSVQMRAPWGYQACVVGFTNGVVLMLFSLPDDVEFVSLLFDARFLKRPVAIIRNSISMAGL